jgi:hypothetical protein
MSERDLKIKTNVVLRLTKDIRYFVKEADAQRAKIEKWRADETKDR